jgi:hypothetical protein
LNENDKKAATSLPAHIGKYEVVRVLGRGAMGVVYQGHDPLLDRDVAIKVMLPQTAADPDQKARFEREARAAAKIVHRNVLTVFDLGYHQDGSPYIAMEMLKGKDLLQTMREDPPLPLDQKLNVIVQLLDGLAHAHGSGVVHRDIKPANVFLVSDGTVKIMDFGVARFTMSSATNSGMVMGTPDYMSPEQVSGAKVDGRTDIWSAGCVLHELLTGQRPFAADSLMTIFYRITHDTPTPELPSQSYYDPLRRVVRRALERDADARYQDAAEFASDLRRILKELPAEAVAESAAAPPGAPASAEVETTAHAVDLLDALADEEMDALASAVRRGPPVVKPAEPEPPSRPAVDKIAKPTDPTPLFQLLRDIVTSAKTGNLHFQQGEERRSLFFLRGDVLHGSTNVEGEHLGHTLVRYGFIDQATLERAVPVVLKERKRLGVLLQEMGVLTAPRVEEGIGLHVRDVLSGMMDRGEGEFTFEDVVMDGAEMKAPVLAEQIILEAARRLQAPDIVARILGDVDRPLLLSARARVAMQKLTLSPTDGFLLSRIDGRLTAKEIFTLIPLPQEDVERSLFALLCTGMVEYAPRTSRVRAAAEPAPSAQAPAPRTGASQAAIPSPPAPAAPVRATEAELAEARASVGAAEKLIAEDKPKEAVDALGPALLHLLGEESIRARLVLARAMMMLPKMYGRADSVLTQALRDSPLNPDLHVAHGRLYRLRGDRAAAAASFRRALELAPSHPEALAESQAGAGAPDPSQSGAGRR